MKILHISDTHGLHGSLPESIFDVDMVIHSGDCSNYKEPMKNLMEVLVFLDWYRNLDVKHKIYVAGNHDTSIERRLVHEEHFGDVIYLEHKEVEIEGIRIFGSPYTPSFGDWAFMKQRHKLHYVWDSVDYCDILVTHGPPKGVRDLTYNRDGELELCGDLALAKWVFRNQPRYHMFGHIHDMDGIHNQGVSNYSKCPTTFSNGSCVTDGKRIITSHGNTFTI